MQQMQPQSESIDVEVYDNEAQIVISQVYLLMTLGLVITAIVAAWIAGNPRLVYGLFSNWWGPLILFGVQIGLVIALTAAVFKLAPGVAVALFIGYSALTGVTLSIIFLVYTDTSIATTFLITAGTFGVMSIFGFVTKRDLTKLGSLFVMLLLGFVIASVVNLFLQSASIYWILTFAGIAIFVGLIAYDTQKIKRMATSGRANGKARSALAVMGALALYLDFINLFLLLLRLFGRRR